MHEAVGILAAGAPALQVALMGVIGYPLAVRRPGGMERFHRSGFGWWLIALAIVALVGLAASPESLAPTAPAAGAASASGWLLAVAAGFGAIFAIEAGGEALTLRRGTRSAREGRARYDAALPAWAAGAGAESALLTVTAVLEEAVYRAVALGALVGAFAVAEEPAVALVAIVFGAAHWYFGVSQVALKVVVGAVLGAVAITTGWVAAAAVHAAVNLTLVALARRAAA